MQVDTGVLLQPGAHLGMVMGGVVVQHEVQLTPGIGAGDLLTEHQELGVAMSIEAAVGDLAGGDLQSGEQRRRTMPDVVVGAALGAARTQRQVCWVRSGAWIWDFSSTHSTTARSGGWRYSPTTS